MSLCKGPKQSANLSQDMPTTSTNTAKVAASPPKSIGPNSKKVTLLSPIINSSDAIHNESFKLSSHFCTVLSSLDMLYHPYSGLISFKCHYCSTPLPTSGMSWNTARVVEVLPNMVAKHLTADDEYGEYASSYCLKVPSSVLQKLQSSDNVESSRIRSFDAFLQSFFRRNGIVERSPDKRLAYGVALAERQLTSYHSGERKESPAKKRRSEGGAEKSPKRAKDAVVYPPSLKVKIGNMVSRKPLRATVSGFIFVGTRFA